MATTRTLYKSGQGDSTAALVAGTVTNVAVVTLPSDPGYEYDVSISIMLKATGATVSAVALVGDQSFALSVSAGGTGGIFPFPGYFSGATTPNGSATFAPASAGAPQFPTVTTFKSGPGTAITVPILSNASDTYYLHYNYVGRKVVTEDY